MTTEEKAKAYDEALKEAKKWHKTFVSGQNYPATDIKVSYEWIFPELEESEDDRIRKEIIAFIKKRDRSGCDYDYDKWIAWLEKQVYPQMVADAYLKGCNDTEKKWLEKQGETSDQIHYWTEEEIEPIISDYLRGAEHYGGMIARLRCLKPKSLEKQGEPKEYTFKSIPRLLNMIEPSDRAKAYCQKLIGSLVREGYNTDAKIIDEVLKGWNGEDVPMAVMDEKQGRIDNCPLECSTNTVMTDSKKNQVEPKFKKKSQRIISAEAKESLYDKPATIDIDKMVDDYANNEEFGKPLNCMVRAYRQGLKDAIGKIVSESAWSEEDEEMLDGIILRCEKYGHQEQINWLKSIKQRIKGE